MFCPRCSQEQVSEEIKFCSRCGFPLGLVSEILANGGFLPQLAEIYKNKKLFTRRNGLIFTLFWFLIFVFILTPLFGIAGIRELAGAAVVIGTMGGFVMLLASFTLFQKEPKHLQMLNQQLPVNNLKSFTGTQQNALPPLQTRAAQDYFPPANAWKDPKTDDLAQPGSIIEGTTKLLSKED